MSQRVLEVYYDYVSPFAYMASHLADSVAERHGCRLVWKPIDLHALSNFASGMPYSSSKRSYVALDALRQAQYHELPIAMPNPFPVQSGKALRIALVAQAEGAFGAFHLNVFDAAWVQSRDIGSAEVLQDVVARSGGDAERWLAEARAPAVEERLRELTEEAENRGVFGVPTIVANDELFWGIDSFPILEWRLSKLSG